MKISGFSWLVGIENQTDAQTNPSAEAMIAFDEPLLGLWAESPILRLPGCGRQVWAFKAINLVPRVCFLLKVTILPRFGLKLLHIYIIPYSHIPCSYFTLCEVENQAPFFSLRSSRSSVTGLPDQPEEGQVKTPELRQGVRPGSW